MDHTKNDYLIQLRTLIPDPSWGRVPFPFLLPLFIGGPDILLYATSALETALSGVILSRGARSLVREVT